MLAPGVDKSGNIMRYVPPRELFPDHALALYDQIREDQALALAKGAAGQVGRSENNPAVASPAKEGL